jgi:transcriptional regulator with XRE-family HTH domain
MMEDGAGTRRAELGEFLRARRARLSPAHFGLPATGRRRTPGLRREEVAQLCGLSVTWYTWLEQGRDISLSAPALGRLATVLRLTQAERAYLFDLAGRRDPRAASEPRPGLPDGLLDALFLIACPAYLLDHRWDLQGANEPARRLFASWLDGPEAANLLRYIFLDPAARTLIVDWEERARRVVAEYRADYSRHLDDPAMQDLAHLLSERSPLFGEAWAHHAVIGREGGGRRFLHPVDGPTIYNQVTLCPASRPSLKLVVLTPLRDVGAVALS